MALDNDVQKLASFLDHLNYINNLSPIIKEPIINIKESCNIHGEVIVEKDKKLYYLENSLKENENCYSLLNVIESSIKHLLEKCVNEQKLVKANVETYLRKQNSSLKRDRYLRNILSTPYFKDDNGFSHSYNDDVSLRNVQGFLNPCNAVIPRPWSESEKRVLIEFIRNVEVEKWNDTLKSCNMLHLANVEQMTLEELVESRFNEYDWLNISVSYLKNAHSPEECRALWFHCEHPKINKEAWSEEENKRLKTLVLCYKGQDWDKIVEELGTNRSPFQCIIHFKKHMREKTEGQWTEEDTSLLKHYVKLFSFKGYIPWLNVKMFMDGQSFKEIARKWDKINSEGKPRTFSLEEDIVLVAGMKFFGNNYPRIREYLPDRTTNQVRRRIEVLKRRQFPKQAWSAQEDELLRNLLDKYGYGNWLKISLHFVNRSHSAVRKRYITLLQRKDKESHASLRLGTPRKKTDIVDLPLLWESVVRICQENNIVTSIDDFNNSSLNIVHQLSQILKPQMRLSETVEEKKLKPFLDKEYSNFLQGAYMLDESKRERTCNMRKSINTIMHDIVIVLKLLDAKINLPEPKKLKNEPSISCQDKFIINHLINEIGSRKDVCSDVFLPPNKCKENMVADENARTSSDNLCNLFPPNFSTLLAMRSLLLNLKNLEEQKQGLTMQLDNVELKEMNTFCSPRRIYYGKNHMVASKKWIERMNQLLGGVAVILKKEELNSPCSNRGKAK